MIDENIREVAQRIINGSEEYTCSICGNTYLKAWTDEEAMDESKQNFPEATGQPVSIVCDDCYKQFMTQWEKNP